MAVSKFPVRTPSLKASLYAFRASESYAIFVVCVAVFSDILLQNLVVPVLPYALEERVGLTDQDDIQKWNSILLGAFGATFMLGSCTYANRKFLHLEFCFGGFLCKTSYVSVRDSIRRSSTIEIVKSHSSRKKK